MKTLNLTNLDTSDIKYQVSKFPDGQQQVKIDNSILENDGEDEWFVPLSKKTKVLIISRLNNFSDLELIICTVASLREIEVKEIHLKTPYFLGSRSDRKFEEGSNNYLKTVICPIINNLNFESVTVLDPHSDVLEACLNNFKKIDNLKLVQFALYYINGVSKPKDNVILISPDAGAGKKIFKIAEKLGYTNEILTCSKERDTEGKLTKTVVPGLDKLDVRKDCIIIDDICDGGRTFINIVKTIKKNHDQISSKDKGKFYLIVTHGIFSAGFEELNKYFDGIYCTNSYKTIGDYEHNGNKQIKTNVKQYDIF